MGVLTEVQVIAFNLKTAEALREGVREGHLADSPEINSLIAVCCHRGNPATWERSRWYKALWVGPDIHPYRADCRVQRITLPKGPVLYLVTAEEWCDCLTKGQAQAYLKSLRDKRGGLLYLSAREEAAARQQYYVHANSAWTTG